MKPLKQKSNDSTKNEHKIIDASLHIIEESVMTFFSNPQESKHCHCNICCQLYEIKEKGKDFLRRSSSMFKLNLKKYRKFYEFLSRVDSKVYFRLQIPEMCFFQDGEGKEFFRTQGIAIQMKELQPQMRKNIPDFFAQAKKVIQNPKNISATQQNHIKYFDTIVPSHINGMQNNSTNKAKHYCFHSNDLLLEDVQVVKVNQNSNSDVAVIKFKQKGKGFQLVNQKQLRTILKPGSKSYNIQFIQSYIKPHQKKSGFIFAEYIHYHAPQNMLMFTRSKTHVKVQINLISKYSSEYIPIDQLQDYEQLLKQIPQEYCLYQTYKMIHYMEINRDIKVTKLYTVWITDHLQQIVLFGVSEFDYEQIEKVELDSIDPDELKDVLAGERTELQKELLIAWEHMKERKLRPEERKMSLIDLEEEREIQKIKMEAIIRKQKVKQDSSKKKVEKK